jgi:hypothetical protein
MSSQLLGPNREADIWARLIRAQNCDPSAETAEFLLSIAFEDRDQKRMLELAERSEAGVLSVEEQAEFDSYLHIGNFLAVLQSKARIALKKNPQQPHYS